MGQSLLRVFGSANQANTNADLCDTEGHLTTAAIGIVQCEELYPQPFNTHLPVLTAKIGAYMHGVYWSGVNDAGSVLRPAANLVGVAVQRLESRRAGEQRGGVGVGQKVDGERRGVQGTGNITLGGENHVDVFADTPGA